MPVATAPGAVDVRMWRTRPPARRCRVGARCPPAAAGAAGGARSPAHPGDRRRAARWRTRSHRSRSRTPAAGDRVGDGGLAPACSRVRAWRRCDHGRRSRPAAALAQVGELSGERGRQDAGGGTPGLSSVCSWVESRRGCWRGRSATSWCGTERVSSPRRPARGWLASRRRSWCRRRGPWVCSRRSVRWRSTNCGRMEREGCCSPAACWVSARARPWTVGRWRPAGTIADALRRGLHERESASRVEWERGRAHGS